MSTPHLRTNMRDILDLLREIANSIHAKVSQRMKEGGDRFVIHSTCDMLTLALDTVVALGNFTDRQLMGGADLSLNLNGISLSQQFKRPLCHGSIIPLSFQRLRFPNQI